MPITTASKPASEKQRAFARKLATERPQWDAHLNGALYERAFDLVCDPSKFVSIREDSDVIDALLRVPQGPSTRPTSTPTGVPGQDGTPPLARPAGPTPIAAPGKAEPGIYTTPNGDIVKVQMNRAKTNTYALRWVEIAGERLVDATEEHVRGEWDYAPGLVFGMDPAWRMTVEQAKAFILRYGQCARCGRKLKAAKSVEAGIGPVCIKEFTW